MIEKVNAANKEEARKLLESYAIQCDNNGVKHASLQGEVATTPVLIAERSPSGVFLTIYGIQGLIADQIVGLAQGASPDLIVMGTRDLDPVAG